MKSTSEVLQATKEVMEKVSLEDIYRLPEDDRSRKNVEKLIKDLEHFQP